MRIGDIVKTPATGGLYSDLPAIVLAKKGIAVTVHTGKAELVYEQDMLRPCGTIKLGRAYAHGTLRFRVCVYTGVNGKTKEVHVITRDVGDLGEETRALEIRKMAFRKLMESD